MIEQIRSTEWWPLFPLVVAIVMFFLYIPLDTPVRELSMTNQALVVSAVFLALICFYVFVKRNGLEDPPSIEEEILGDSEG